jgi:hypothetical protein
MPTEHEPIVLELAPLPREEVGPFLLLGLSKAADKEEIEANWAQRVIWARKKQMRVPLEDVNWAREVINDRERRVRADVAGLNLDTSDSVLERLMERYGGSKGKGTGWQPLDWEKPLADYSPPTEVPDANEVKSAIRVPDVPLEVPVVLRMLEQFLKEPLDPWKLSLDLKDPAKGGEP